MLAVWRITHLLSSEDGPWRLVFRFRQKLRGTAWAELFNCFYCLSVWVAAPFAYWTGGEPAECALLWPALSAAAILLERVTQRFESNLPAAYFEHEENRENAVLR